MKPSKLFSPLVEVQCHVYLCIGKVVGDNELYWKSSLNKFELKDDYTDLHYELLSFNMCW